MLVPVLAEHENGDIDRFKVIRLILVHDLGEVDAGDVFLFDESKGANNSAAEQQGARRIFGLLPKEQYTIPCFYELYN